MALYRASPKDGVAWITGASTGIGRALARDFAEAGYTVAITARDEERLLSLVDETQGLSGKVVPFTCDVTDEDAMRRTVIAIEKEAGPIVLAVFNAGTYFPTRGERLDVLNFVSTYEINFFGVLYGLVPVVLRMQERGYGQVVVVGSVTAYFGMPSAAAYGSSKAALNNMAEALKYDLDKLNIRIQMINPGFVDTPLTRQQKFTMPGLLKVEEASRRIMDAISSGGFETAFPRRLTWAMRLLYLLPHPLRFVILNYRTGWRSRPMAAPRKLRG